MLYGDGTSDGGYYDRETLYQYGLGECGELGGLFSFVGKAVKGVAGLVPGGSVVASLIPGGGGPSAPSYVGYIRASDGAKWSASKRRWEYSGEPAPAGVPLSKAVMLLPTAAAIAGGYRTEMGPGAVRYGLSPTPSIPRMPAPSAPTMRPGPSVPPILRPARAPGGPNVPAYRPPIPATPSEAAGAPAPAGYGGTPAFPLLPVLIGVGLLGAFALARSSGGRNWQ